MTRELWNLDKSGRQMPTGLYLNDLPIVNIKSASFFKPALWTTLIPLRAVNQLRDRMHEKLQQLSTTTLKIKASNSGHFVWIDQPTLITQAIARRHPAAQPRTCPTRNRRPSLHPPPRLQRLPLGRHLERLNPT